MCVCVCVCVCLMHKLPLHQKQVYTDFLPASLEQLLRTLRGAVSQAEVLI